MAIGYILIGAKNSFEHKVANKISMLDEVIDVEPLIVEEIALAEPFFENYDLIVKVKLNFAKDFNNFINQKLRKIPGIEKTKMLSKTKKIISIIYHRGFYYETKITKCINNIHCLNI